MKKKPKTQIKKGEVVIYKTSKNKKSGHKLLAGQERELLNLLESYSNKMVTNLLTA